MKKIAILLLVFFNSISFSQTNKSATQERSVTIISIGYSNPKVKCEFRALKVYSDKVEADNCYDLNAKKFKPSVLGMQRQGKFYNDIFNKSASDWNLIQSMIDKKDCDYLKLFVVELRENNVTKTFKLKRMDNCYPASTKELMTNLEHYFIDNEIFK